VTIVFRADASDRIGTGHVMRCARLARALQARGARIRFVCRDHPGHLVAQLNDGGIPVAVLRRGADAHPTAHSPRHGGPGGAAEHDYAAWLGGSQLDDAEETIAALKPDVPEWLIVDHYGIDATWEERLRPHVRRILVVDDLADRAHDCDLLLDQNYSAEGERRYAGLVPSSCRRMVGPRYALLSPDYARHRRTRPAHDGTVRRVLLFFGGVDRPNVTARALTALSAPELGHLAVDLVIGTNHPARTALERQAAGRPGTCVHGVHPHLADLMVRADLAVGAGGVTTWERMCVGVPAVVVSLAENQRPTCEALAAADLIEYVGDHRSVDAEQIRSALTRLLADRERLTALSMRGRELVDGRGVSRVADAMRPPTGEELIRTRNALHDAGVHPSGFDRFAFAWIDRCRADEVLALRNMPHVTAQMRSRAAIGAAEHRRFLEAYSRLDRYDFVLIDTTRDRYVGMFYVTNVASTPEIGKYLGDPGYLGKGIAARATERLLEFCHGEAGLHRVVSVTRRGNARNIALNARLGFVPSGAHGEFVVMALEL
jgi:UDP-2,4-diacetamido-2,4,6-trideoxy-beta-L-altropyranose hydrolase